MELYDVVTATTRVLYAGCAKMCLKHYMPFQPVYIITRNQCTQRIEAKALGIPAIERNTRPNMSGEAMPYKMFVRKKIYSVM